MCLNVAVKANQTFVDLDSEFCGVGWLHQHAAMLLLSSHSAWPNSPISKMCVVVRKKNDVKNSPRKSIWSNITVSQR